MMNRVVDKHLKKINIGTGSMNHSSVITNFSKAIQTIKLKNRKYNKVKKYFVTIKFNYNKVLICHLLVH